MRGGKGGGWRETWKREGEDEGGAVGRSQRSLKHFLDTRQTFATLINLEREIKLKHAFKFLFNLKFN